MKDNVILKVYKYFLPSAWKRYKGYFIIRFLRLIVNTITPFVPILFMPRIVLTVSSPPPSTARR